MKIHTTAEDSAPTAAPYDANPIMLAIRGVERLFAYVKPLAIVLLVASLLLVVLQMTPGMYPADQSPVETGGEQSQMNGGAIAAMALAILPLGLAGLLIFAGVILAFIFIAGVIDFSAAAAARKRKVTLSETMGEVMQNFWPYALMRVIVAVKIFLWSLLFIVPGIYFAYRYILSGVVFFAEGTRGNAALKRSLALTKNAWLTTVSSYGLLNLLTLGSVQMLSDAGTSAELYSNYKNTVDGGKAHPRPHTISWVSFAVTLLVAGLLLIGLMLLGIGAAFNTAP